MHYATLLSALFLPLLVTSTGTQGNIGTTHVNIDSSNIKASTNWGIIAGQDRGTIEAQSSKIWVDWNVGCFIEAWYHGTTITHQFLGCRWSVNIPTGTAGQLVDLSLNGWALEDLRPSCIDPNEGPPGYATWDDCKQVYG